jgi:hypothetical protein
MKSAFQKIVLLCLLVVISHGFTPSSFGLSRVSSHFSSTSKFDTAESVDSSDDNDIIGMTITVKGDVNGGYTRTCIRNEVSVLKLRMVMNQWRCFSNYENTTI